MSRSSFASISLSRASSSGEILEVELALMAGAIGAVAVGVGRASALGDRIPSCGAKFESGGHTSTSPPAGVINFLHRSSLPPCT